MMKPNFSHIFGPNVQFVDIMGWRIVLDGFIDFVHLRAHISHHTGYVETQSGE